jgi:hypothetical protein
MSPKTESILVYTAYAMVFIFLVTMCMYLEGCAILPKKVEKCSNPGAYRCNEQMIERCVCGKWVADTDCSEFIFNGAEYFIFYCKQEGADAECLPAM